MEGSASSGRMATTISAGEIGRPCLPPGPTSRQQGYAPPARDDSELLRDRRLLEKQAEEEKIRLSRADSVDVVFDGRIADGEGRPIDGVVTVSRAEFEALIADDVTKAIDITRTLIEGHGLDASSVDRSSLSAGRRSRHCCARTSLLRLARVLILASTR